MERDIPSYTGKGGLGSYPQHHPYNHLSRPTSLPVFDTTSHLEHVSPFHSPFYRQGHYESLLRGKEDRRSKFMIGDPLLVSPTAHSHHAGHHVSPRFYSPQFVEETSYDKYATTPPSPTESSNYTDSQLSQYSPAHLLYSPVFPFDSPFYEGRGSYSPFRRESPQPVKYSPISNVNRTPHKVIAERNHSPMKLSPSYFDCKEIRPLDSPDRVSVIEEMRCRNQNVANQRDVISDCHSNGIQVHPVNDSRLGPSTKEKIHREFAHRFLLENARATDKNRFHMPFSKDFESLRAQLMPNVEQPAQLPSHHCGGAIRRSVICKPPSAEKNVTSNDTRFIPQHLARNDSMTDNFHDHIGERRSDNCNEPRVDNYHPTHNLFEKVFNVGSSIVAEKKSTTPSKLDFDRRHASKERDAITRYGSETSLRNGVGRISSTLTSIKDHKAKRGTKEDTYSGVDMDRKLLSPRLAPNFRDIDRDELLIIESRSRKSDTSANIDKKERLDTRNAFDIVDANIDGTRKMSVVHDPLNGFVETKADLADDGKYVATDLPCMETDKKQERRSNFEEKGFSNAVYDEHNNRNTRQKSVIENNSGKEPVINDELMNDQKSPKSQLEEERNFDDLQKEEIVNNQTKQCEDSEEEEEDYDDEKEEEESVEEISEDAEEFTASPKESLLSEGTGNDEITNKRVLSREERAILYAMQKFKEMEEKKTSKKRKEKPQDPPEKKRKVAESKEALLIKEDIAGNEMRIIKKKPKKIKLKQKETLQVCGNVLSDETNPNDKERKGGVIIGKNVNNKSKSRHKRLEKHLRKGEQKMKKLKFDHVKKQQAPKETRLAHKDDDGEHTKECEITAEKDALHGRPDMHQKSYLLVPSYKGFKDFAPVLLEGRTRQRSTQTDAERVGKPKFPILVVETVGEKRNEILVKENEDLDKKIAKESLLAEKIFEDVTYEEGKLKTSVRHLSCNRMTGETVLHKAARLGYDDVVDIKIKEGADVNARDNAGWTALHEACVRGKTDVVKVLLRYGADPNCRSENGIRPLHDAVESGNMDIIRLLLRYGADIAEETYSGLKVLQLARTQHVRELLKGYIVDIQATELLEADEDISKDRWEFRGSASFLDKQTDDADEIFGEFPMDSDIQIEFVASSKEPLPVYNLPVFRDNKTVVGYRNYYILKDVLDTLAVTRGKFLKKHKVELRTLSWTEFVNFVRQSQIALLPSPPSTSSDSEEPFIDLVHFGNFTARKLFDIKAYQV